MQQSLVILISSIIVIVGLWKEWSRPAKAHLALRMVCLLIAAAAFACLILPLSYQSAISKTDANEAVLLTDGYDKDSLSAYPNRRIYTLSPSIEHTYPKAIALTDAGALNEVKPQISRLHVLGYGLPAAQLKQLHPLPLLFTANMSPAGITAVNHTAQLTTGQHFQVQGTYHNTSGRPVKMLLKGLGTLLDSVTLSAQAHTSFSLTALPKHTGRAVYHLLVLRGTDTLEQEPLPVNIEPVKPLSILLLSATPDFENKFLKNWLSANGYSAAIRSSISKAKSSTEFVNMAQLPLDKLSAQALERFDVVTGDLASLKALSPSENAALYQQISQKGLGLIIRADTSVQASGWLQSGFPITKAPGQKPVATRLSIAVGRPSAAVLNIEPAYISYRLNTQPLVTDPQNRILASIRLAGTGRLIYTTLTQTYSWALGGNTVDYATLWTTLLNRAARKKAAVANWRVSSSMPIINGRVSFTTQSSTPPQRVRLGSSEVAPVQNPLLPFEWVADYWPEASGWQQAMAANGTPAYGYIYDKNDWQPLQLTENYENTLVYAANHPVNTPVTKLIQQNIRIEIPKIYFYILLLLACGYLWAESRALS